MLSNKMRRLCPYLKKTTTRQDAASTSYSLPDAIKRCPYVKELFSGFGNKGQELQEEKETTQKSGYEFNESKEDQNEPSLFKMDEYKSNISEINL